MNLRLFIFCDKFESSLRFVPEALDGSVSISKKAVLLGSGPASLSHENRTKAALFEKITLRLWMACAQNTWHPLQGILILLLIILHLV